VTPSAAQDRPHARPRAAFIELASANQRRGQQSSVDGQAPQPRLPDARHGADDFPLRRLVVPEVKKAMRRFVGQIRRGQVTHPGRVIIAGSTRFGETHSLTAGPSVTHAGECTGQDRVQRGADEWSHRSF
jgi:hypothetical protein